MITIGEIIKDLESLKKKAEFAQITYPNNDIWPEIVNKISELLIFVKKDTKIFGYRE